MRPKKERTRKKSSPFNELTRDINKRIEKHIQSKFLVIKTSLSLYSPWFFSLTDYSLYIHFGSSLTD